MQTSTDVTLTLIFGCLGHIWAFFYFHVFLSTGSWDKRLGCLPLQWIISSPLLSSPPVSQQHYTSTEASQCHITTRSYHPKNLYRPSVSRDVSIFFSAVKTRAGCYCKAPFLVSNPLLQFSQWRLHLSLTALALPCLALHCPAAVFIYAQTRYAPK